MKAALVFEDWIKAVQDQMECALLHYLPLPDCPPAGLHEAMRYAVLEGGKRVRPLLVYAAGALFDADEAELARVGVAVELIHAYSLVHDDMPAMDNDVLRRGKATVHVKYGEANALLVGDALQSQAFEILAGGSLSPQRQLDRVRLLAQAAGSRGMCGGQAIDLSSVGLALSLDELEYMHRLKTGALLRASVLLGAMTGQDLCTDEKAALDAYAAAIGLAFQVVDDVLDATTDSTLLGKTAGKDQQDNKPTYVSILGLEKSRALAETLRDDAHRALAPFNDKAQRLRDIANLIVKRKA